MRIYTRWTLGEALAHLESRSTRDGACLMVPTKGYGEVSYGGRKRVPAHRASFMVHNGELLPGQVVRHTCDRPGCIEPTHLIAGTVADNVRDRVERRRESGLRHGAATVPPEVIREAVTEYLRGGKTQAQMGRRLGVSAGTFGKWVRGETRQDSGLKGVTVGTGSQIARGVPSCGTRGGYRGHRKRGETPCVACCDANSNYFRGLRANASRGAAA